jgi:hypothetical protein
MILNNELILFTKLTKTVIKTDINYLYNIFQDDMIEVY